MRAFTSVAVIALAIAAAPSAAADPLSASSSATPAAAVGTPALASSMAQPNPAPAAAVIPAAATPPVGEQEPEPAVAKPSPPPAPRVVARIDLTSQRMTVAIDGKPTHSWAISSGRAGFLTPRGTFRPQWSAKMWYSRKYDDAPMPHAVFFNGGIATHATSATHLLGQPASHGCIRLSPANAAAFYALVHKHGYHATRIHVQGVTPAPAVARRNRSQEQRFATSRPNRPTDPYAYPAYAVPSPAMTAAQRRIAAPQYRPVYVRQPYRNPAMVIMPQVSAPALRYPGDPPRTAYSRW